MSDLLPPSATPYERALASMSERFDRLLVPYRQMWNPEQCPVELLPYLANSFSIDQWDDSWPEHIKRQAVKDALYQHRIKGSLQAVLDAVAAFGTLATVTEWWQRTPRGEPHTFSVDISAQDNERLLPVFEIAGAVWLYCSQPIPVQASRVYKIRFKVRQTVDDAHNRIYAGVATLDKNYNNLTGGAGKHRYCAVAGAGITASDGWQTFAGEITGVGDDYHQFREGTAFIRPMFIVNYHVGKGTAQVAEMECWDLFENKQLIPNPHFKDGKKGWSRNYSGETAPDNAPGTITTAAFRPDADLQTDIINAITRAKPLRSDFELKVGTVHPGNFYWTADVYPVVMIRETFGP